VGVEELMNQGVRIYPNPSDGILAIESQSTGQHFIEITTMNGQMIYSEKMDGTTHKLDLSSFQKGVYIITIRSEDLVTTRKIIRL